MDWKHAVTFIVAALLSFGVVKATDVCTGTTTAPAVVSAPAQ